MTNIFKCILITFSLVFSSCSSTLTPDKLFGEWEYVNIEHLGNSSESTSKEELREANASIQFSRNDQLVIFWGGRRLSHGTFRIEGQMIWFNERLEKGRAREFPFLVSKLTDRELIFETMERNGTRVTARRVR